VVKQAYVYQIQRISDAPRYKLIRLAGLSNARGVVMRKNDSGSISGQRLFNNFPGVNSS
jgi:hypothetical protein